MLQNQIQEPVLCVLYMYIQDSENYKEIFGGVQLVKLDWPVPVEKSVTTGAGASTDELERDVSLAISSQELLVAVEKLFKVLPAAEHKSAAAKV